MYDKIITLTKKNGMLLKQKAGKIKDIGITKKYLTELDLKIERDFEKMIGQFDGNHTIFAEEEHDNIKNSESIWVIDPISSTYNFIHGFPHYELPCLIFIKDSYFFL